MEEWIGLKGKKKWHFGIKEKIQEASLSNTSLDAKTCPIFNRLILM